jgi:hypothetical protein
VLKLRGVNFTWKTEPAMGKRIGFIAQEVEAILPELVFTNEVDGFKGVQYSEMTAVLVEAIKEQQVIINELKQKVDALTKENSKITQNEADMESLKLELNKIKEILRLVTEK